MIPIGHLPRNVSAAWAHHPLRNEMVAHWFVRCEGGPAVRVIRSTCGLVKGYETVAVRLLNPGDLPRCKHCERMRKAAA